MSKRDAERLIKDLHSKKELRQRVHGAAEEIVRVAVEQGYEVSREDISDALKEHWKKGDDSLKDKGCIIIFSEAPGF